MFVIQRFHCAVNVDYAVLYTKSLFLLISWYSEGFRRKFKSGRALLVVVLENPGTISEKIVRQTPHKKWNFPLKTSSVNVTKSAVSCGLRIWSHLLKKSLIENFIFCGKKEKKSIKNGEKQKSLIYVLLQILVTLWPKSHFWKEKWVLGSSSNQFFLIFHSFLIKE